MNNHDLIIINPDAKTRAAFDTWQGGLKAEDKEGLSIVDDQFIVSMPDPDDKVRATRQGLIDLVAANAEVPHDIVSIRWRGKEVESTGIIVQKVADPEDD